MRNDRTIIHKEAGTNGQKGRNVLKMLSGNFTWGIEFNTKIYVRKTVYTEKYEADVISTSLRQWVRRITTPDPQGWGFHDELKSVCVK
jgi:hypothetical protein